MNLHKLFFIFLQRTESNSENSSVIDDDGDDEDEDEDIVSTEDDNNDDLDESTKSFDNDITNPEITVSLFLVIYSLVNSLRLVRPLFYIFFIKLTYLGSEVFN